MKYLVPTVLSALLLATPVMAQLTTPPAQSQPQQPRRATNTNSVTTAKPAPAKPAAAQANSNALPPGAKAFDNWVFSCQTMTGTDNQPLKGCNLRSNLVVEDPATKQKSVAVGIIIGRMMVEKQPQILLQLPLSAFLAEPPRVFSGDGTAVAQLTWVACNQQFCLANATLADAQIAALSNTGNSISVSYRTQTGQEIKVDGAAKGIDAALNALNREK